MKKSELKAILKRQSDMIESLSKQVQKQNKELSELYALKEKLVNKALEEKQKLNMANNTVAQQIDTLLLKDKIIDTSTTMGKQTEKHLQIAEAEIKRLNVIINYLEMRGK